VALIVLPWFPPAVRAVAATEHNASTFKVWIDIIMVMLDMAAENAAFQSSIVGWLPVPFLWALFCKVVSNAFGALGYSMRIPFNIPSTGPSLAAEVTCIQQLAFC
jgi:hypothetical protein